MEAYPANMLSLTAFPTPHDRMLHDGYCLRHPSRPRHSFSDNKIAAQSTQMTQPPFGMPCSLSSDGVITLPAGKPPDPGPSRGHKKHPVSPLTRLTFFRTVCNNGSICLTHGQMMPCITLSPCAVMESTHNNTGVDDVLKNQRCDADHRLRDDVRKMRYTCTGKSST